MQNSPYQGEEGNTMRMCVEPDMITRLVEETGCGLLLDISHAIITARYLGVDPHKYMQRMPVDKLRELHFAGIHWNRMSKCWVDHLSIQKLNWHWLDWVLDRVRLGEWSTPWLLAFEYGGVGEAFKWRTDPGIIAEQIPQLYERVKLRGG